MSSRIYIPKGYRIVRMGESIPGNILAYWQYKDANTIYSSNIHPLHWTLVFRFILEDTSYRRISGLHTRCIIKK